VSHQSFVWRHRGRAFLDEESGVSATEYAIVLAVLILGSFGVIRSIGSSFRNIYLAIAAKIPEA
jgi:Flp pilus assembly pilin Flp